MCVSRRSRWNGIGLHAHSETTHPHALMRCQKCSSRGNIHEHPKCFSPNPFIPNHNTERDSLLLMGMCVGNFDEYLRVWEGGLKYLWMKRWTAGYSCYLSSSLHLQHCLMSLQSLKNMHRFLHKIWPDL